MELSNTKMTPLKIYREWFAALRPDWAIEIARDIIKDSLLTPFLFLENNRDNDDCIVYDTLDSIENFPQYLINVIDNKIDLGYVDYERLLCQQLLFSTTYALIKYSADNADFNKMLQETQMENLILNELENAAFYEENLNKSIQSQAEAKELKLKWDKFAAQYFNMELFYQQEYS